MALASFVACNGIDVFCGLQWPWHLLWLAMALITHILLDGALVDAYCKFLDQTVFVTRGAA
jgi:hypothetical protein